MRVPVALVLAAILLSGCSSLGNRQQLEARQANDGWNQCTQNATQSLSLKFQDSEMVARYALHLCEQWKIDLINAQIKYPGSDVKEVTERVDKFEEKRLQELKMLSTKYREDRIREIDQELSKIPLDFN